jgi:hypothetical protein
VVRKELGYTADITLVNQAGTARTRVAFDLPVLVTEVMATFGCIPLEAFRCLTKTLRRGPVGFQLGHELTPIVASGRKLPSQPLAGEQRQVLEDLSAVTSF